MPYREARAKIDGRVWEMRTHDASEAIDLMKGLGKYLPANILQILILAQVNAEAIEKLNEPSIMAAMLAAVYGHSPVVASDKDSAKDLSYWIRECFKHTTVDPLPFGVNVKGSAYDHFDTLFSGDLNGVVEVLKWLLPANFTKPPSSPPSPDGEDIPSSEDPTKASSPQVSIRVSSSPAKPPPETST